MSPVTEYDVAAEPVLSVMTLYVSGPILSSILYPVIDCLYVSDGGTQESVIDVGDTAVAVSPTGDPGVLADDEDEVTDDSSDGAPVPI